MFKRIGLFLLTNILVMITISIVLNVLGVGPYLRHNSIDYGTLAAFCLVWGMVGSLISLAMSRMMAKWSLGVQVIDPNQPGQYSGLVAMVHDIAKRANLSVMPEVGIYDSPEVNAFATGPTKNRSLVAVSTGLLGRMNREEVEGVVGHEIAHIANGDMVTMTLLQGVINAFVMFFARAISFALSQQVKEENRPMVRFFATIVLEIVLGLLGAILVAWFSRQREFRADAGSARYVGAGSMIAALRRLAPTVQDVDTSAPSLATMKISGKGMALFSTHPAIAERIAALETQKFR